VTVYGLLPYPTLFLKKENIGRLSLNLLMYSFEDISSFLTCLKDKVTFIDMF